MQPDKVKAPLQFHTGKEDGFKGFADPEVICFLHRGPCANYAACADAPYAHTGYAELLRSPHSVSVNT